MRKTTEFAQHAADCRVMAARISKPEHKAMLEQMAQTWERLAADRRELLERQRRIAEIESSSPK